MTARGYRRGRRCTMLLLALASIAFARGAIAAEPSPIDIGKRVEMFVDRFLVERLTGDARLKLHEPQRREVVLTLDQPGEDPTSAYFTIFRDDLMPGGPKYRLYYRGVTTDDNSPNQTTLYAESTDGVHFTRPKLRLLEFNGTKENNVVWVGPESAAFAPFIDRKPGVRADERYKAVCYSVLDEHTGAAVALASPDGLRWHRLNDGKSLLPPGSFDSLNVAFWDTVAGKYRLYGRYWTSGNFAGVRAIQSSTSSDFVTWSSPRPNEYPKGAPLEHFYTSATLPCPGAEHILLSFPMRFVPDRKKVPSHPYDGVSDAMFMSSRDGVHFDRTFLEAWLRPGLDERNWTERSTMPAWGILQTSAAEFSMYVSEHYRWNDNRLRRLTIRRHGFASLHAGAAGGEAITPPLVFGGKHLLLNYATSAAGSVRVEVLSAASGDPIAGYSLAENNAPLFGDELDAPVTWQGGRDLSALVGQPVRFRLVLKDADVFALRTGD